MAKEIYLAGDPNPRQAEFFLSTARHTAYGGARGGGKSWAMRRKFVLLALRYDGLRLLLMRRTLPELMENHVRPLLSELSGFVSYTDVRKEFVFPNGSSIKLGYCDAEKDVYQYQGQEYDVIGLEEATHFTEDQMQYITTCSRSVRTDFTPRMYYTCNPGGVGHGWVKRLFIDRQYKKSERAEDYVFIPARITDNKVLMERNPEYMTNLENLSDAKRRMHLDGDWDVLEGQYYEEFSRIKHVIKPFAIPAEWRRFRAMDWGYNDPCCVLWFAVEPDSRVYVYREIYTGRVLASAMAQNITRLSVGEKVDATWSSPDAWQKKGQGDAIIGENIADTFVRNGVPLMRADNSRVQGWQRVREYLADAPDGKPRLQIFASCTNLIRTLPGLYFDAGNPEDVAANCEDHAPEALRYGLMSRPAPNRTAPVQKKKSGFDPFSAPVIRKRNGFLGCT